MGLITSLPCEVLGLVLANCESFTQLRDATLTCKSFYSAWKSHTGLILWNIGQFEIVGFTDALIAVRATEIAKQAILKGHLPPSPFPLGQLSGDVRKPTLDELKVLFNFRHLVECLERLAKDDSHAYWCDFIESLEPEDRINAWMVWKERFHVALYRSFLSGAALYRAYHEPLTLASTCGLPHFLDKFWSNMEDEDGEDEEEEQEEDHHSDPFTPAEKRYLVQYPIFRFEEFQYHGDIFQPLADIFVQESKRKTEVVSTLRGASLYERYGAKQYDPDILERSHSQALFHQLLQFMFVAHSPMLRKIIRNEDGSDYQQRHNEPTLKEMIGRSRTVSVIFFDVFSLEEIIMPEDVEDAGETFVLARPGVERPMVDEANLPGLEYASRNLGLFLHEIKWFSGQPNCYWPGCGTPPPEFQFMRYMLAKYFHLRFKDDTWDWENNRNHAQPILPWIRFIISGDVFCERILVDECEGACALLESINAPIPEPHFVHRSSWP
ncbi:hypothetical protein Aspvir_008114 [Aspergillus viridinutans]|uniref:F-box domain-containing protein n=1 Tax=Aspergillus viridinutans TaxID=75553 RepID=A0A9P3BXI1_ASPVI|nr:uncharacterized protein Aspvir_008114 [Aspergillus viridinutans]GIK04039.1 hypothetical protein Aspvir_008114 [Aspergillus viridinutans]